MSSKHKKVESDEEEGEEYTVERILDKRTNKDGGVEYLIKWEGFSLNDSTWENAANASCPDLIAEFERDHEAKKRKKTESKEGSKEVKDTSEPILQEIIGMNSGKNGEKFFVIKYTDSSATQVSMKEVHARYPTEALKYYEKNLRIPC